MTAPGRNGVPETIRRSKPRKHEHTPHPAWGRNGGTQPLGPVPVGPTLKEPICHTRLRTSHNEKIAIFLCHLSMSKLEIMLRDPNAKLA